MGVTWWQTLLLSVAPVLLTLVVTNYAESRRRLSDVLEREKDRDSQADIRELDRREAVREAWRADKMQAHRELMLFARRLWRCMIDASRVIDSLEKIHTSDGLELTPEINDHLLEIQTVFKPLDDVTKQMDGLIADVQMFCSQEAADAARAFEVKQLMAMMSIHAILAGNGRQEVDGANAYERWRKNVVPVTAFVMAEYPGIARRDLHPSSN